MTASHVGGLLTSLNETAGRVSMHGVREEILRAQADAAGLPLFTIPLPWPCTNEIYEARLRAAVDRAVADGFTHVAFGDLFLEDVRKYREDRLAGTGLTPLFPLWGLPTPQLAREMIAGGLRARVATLDPRVMPRDLIGAEFDEALLARLPPGSRSVRRARRVSHLRDRRPDVLEAARDRVRRGGRARRVRLWRFDPHAGAAPARIPAMTDERDPAEGMPRRAALQALLGGAAGSPCRPPSRRSIPCTSTCRIPR